MLLVLVVGCERSERLKEGCSIQGFNQLGGLDVSCDKKLMVNTVDFSNGVTRKIIQGNIEINKKDYSFDVLLDSGGVVNYVFDFVDTDSADFICSIKKINSKCIELEWSSKRKRVFLRKEITSMH